jgi:exodeoxyribonuclease VII large subunit
VRVSGRLDYYAKNGRVSFIVDKIEPVGKGALDAQLRALIEEIRTLGWLDPARKRRLPRFPRRIAVVTSATSAALQDVINTVRRRCCSVSLLVVDARVQGDRAAADVTDAILELGQRSGELGIDAILVTRGGGSREDLWAFNDRLMASAIVRSPVPVVAAIGHETDVTVAELVADERCSTPTQAAMRLTPEVSALEREADAHRRRLANTMEQVIRGHRAQLTLLRSNVKTGVQTRCAELRVRLGRVESRLQRSSPQAVQARSEARVRALAHRLELAMAKRLGRVDFTLARHRLHTGLMRTVQRSAARLDALRRQLGAVNPSGVLERGYSLTFLESGELVRRPDEAPPGSVLRTRVARGEIRSRVDGDVDTALRPDTPEKPPKKRGVLREPPPGGLFG